MLGKISKSKKPGQAGLFTVRTVYFSVIAADQKFIRRGGFDGFIPDSENPAIPKMLQKIQADQ